MLESLFDKAAGLQASSFIKKRQHRCFLWKYWEIFKNTYFEEYLQNAASEVSEQNPFDAIPINLK